VLVDAVLMDAVLVDAVLMDVVLVDVVLVADAGAVAGMARPAVAASANRSLRMSVLLR